MIQKRKFVSILAVLVTLAIAGSALARDSINVNESRALDQLQREEHHDFSASRGDNAMPPQADLFDHASERYQEVQRDGRVGE